VLLPSGEGKLLDRECALRMISDGVDICATEEIIRTRPKDKKSLKAVQRFKLNRSKNQARRFSRLLSEEQVLTCATCFTCE
jgi:hypothetical protein